MTTEEAQNSKQQFLDELKAAREYIQLELGRISEKSKIALPDLEKLESGDWDFLPKTYVRSFLKTYAQHVGMEVEEVLSRFDKIVAETSSSKSKQTIYDHSLEVSRDNTGKSFSANIASTSGKSKLYTQTGFNTFKGKTLYWIVGTVVLISVVLIIFNLPESGSKKEVEEIPLEQIIRENEQMGEGIQDDYPESSVSEESADESSISTPIREIPVPKQKINLEAVATDECYIRVTADRLDNIVDDVVLIKGYRRSYQADSLLIVVLGNAGGMALEFNGENLGTLGETGRVVTITFGPEGLRTLRRGILKKPPVEEEQSQGTTQEDSATSTDANADENRDNTLDQEPVLENTPANDTSGTGTQESSDSFIG